MKHGNLVLLSNKGLMLKMSAFQIFHSGNSTFVNLFDKTKFSCKFMGVSH